MWKLVVLLVIAIALAHQSSAQAIARQECGVSKGCFFKPEGCDPMKTCVVAVTYKPTQNQTVAFELSALLETGSQDSPGQYVALAFSQDAVMGKDAVTHCIHKGQENGGHVGLSYNPGKANEPLNRPEVEAEVLLTPTYWSQNVDGKLQFVCRFEQKLKSSLEAQKVYDLTQPYFLLLATGNTDAEGKILPHIFTPGDSRFPAITPSTVSLINPTQPAPAVEPRPEPGPGRFQPDSATGRRNNTTTNKGFGVNPPSAEPEPSPQPGRPHDHLHDHDHMDHDGMEKKPNAPLPQSQPAPKKDSATALGASLAMVALVIIGCLHL